MIIKDNEFPVVVQAFKQTGSNDLFVAEQVVNSQNEADHFTSRYAGFLIKAHTVHEEELAVDQPVIDERSAPRRRSSAAVWTTIVVLLLVALVVAGFTTGWIQRTFGVVINN